MVCWFGGGPPLEEQDWCTGYMVYGFSGGPRSIGGEGLA